MHRKNSSGHGEPASAGDKLWMRQGENNVLSTQPDSLLKDDAACELPERKKKKEKPEAANTNVKCHTLSKPLY